MPRAREEASAATRQLALRRMESSRSLVYGRAKARLSSLELPTEFRKAARDPAGDRARRQIQRIPDGAIALVAREEAVQDLGAMLRQRPHRLVDGHRLVELGQAVVGPGVLERLLDELFATAAAQLVDAQAPSQGRDPGPDRRVVAQVVEMLEGARED